MISAPLSKVNIGTFVKFLYAPVTINIKIILLLFLCKSSLFWLVIINSVTSCVSLHNNSDSKKRETRLSFNLWKCKQTTTHNSAKKKLNKFPVFVLIVKAESVKWKKRADMPLREILNILWAANELWTVITRLRQRNYQMDECFRQQLFAINILQRSSTK